MRGIYPVILCGGEGTRLWPVSRSSLPKPYARLHGDHTLVQTTALRARDLLAEPPIFIAGHQHGATLRRQLDEIGIPPGAILLEQQPVGTAAAAIAAASFVAQTDPHALILLLPADHAIQDVPAFRDALETAQPAADGGAIVTFGLAAAHPDTSYGYIRKGEPLPGSTGSFRIDGFHEKPDAKVARGFVQSGAYFWNSGIFLFAAGAFLDEAERLVPHIKSTMQRALRDSRHDGDFIRLGATADLHGISLDHAIMERTALGAVVPAGLRLTDIGSWAAIHDLHQNRENGNAFCGDVMAHNVENSFIRANGKLIAAVGIRDLVVVATDDAILIADRHSAQDVKHIVDKLQKNNRAEATDHACVERPWGSYQVIDSGEGFQVKRIIVKPGQRLSLQMHHKRAEHWTVVQGLARVTCGERVFDLKAGEATEIPLGEKHRLENTGETDMHLIEVQTGSYLGEDDIVRFEDAYGRA